MNGSLLEWDAQDLPERQQTLLAALDWSYDLLSEPERLLLRRLGVFDGGFTLDAAEALTSAAGQSAGAVIGLLSSLVAKSLVVSETDPEGGRRFRLLESVREYTLTQLAALGEEPAARRAHATCFVALVERADPDLRGKRQREWFQRLEQERQNIIAAMQWLATQREWNLLLRLTSAAGLFWLFRGDRGERRHWLEEALEQAADAPAALLLKALVTLGQELSMAGEIDQARGALTEAVALAEALDAPSSLAEAYAYLSWCDLYAGAFDAALANAQSGLTAAQAAGDSWAVALAQYFLGLAFHLKGQPESAVLWLEQAVSGFRSCEDATLIAVALHNLGASSGEAGDRARAVACFQALLQASLELKYPSLVHLTGEWLVLAFAREALESSRASSRHDAASTDRPGPLRSAGSRDVLSGQRCPVGEGAVQPELLVELLGALTAFQHAWGLGRSVEQPQRDRLAGELRERLGDRRFAEAWEQGRSRSPAQTEALIWHLLHRLRVDLIGPPDEPAQPGSGRAAEAATGAGERVSAGHREGDLMSGREREVLALAATGLSNQAIAARLYLSERTVRYHLTSLFNKLGVASRTEAVAVATRRGLV